MNLFDKTLQGIYDIRRAVKGEPRLLHTKFGDIILADKTTRRNAQHIISKLQRTTEALTKSDIQKWRKAWQQAISIESPNRQMLYDIYRDTATDAHVTGCIGQRTGFVLSKSFNIEDKSGKPCDELKHYFDQEWFYELCRLILDSIYYGHSLIELGDIRKDGDGCPCYSEVKLIDRKFVIPEHHRVVTDLGQDWTTGIDYREPEWYNNLIEAGKPDDLGLYLKAALHAIPKKNVLAAWDVFSEVFGMPMRVAKTASRDKADQQCIEEMLKDMDIAPWALFPEGTDIQIIESTKSDAFNVYDKRVDRSNSEISKLIIGQTMTIEDGSSLSQSQTHLKVFENLVESDAKMLASIINNQLIPRMIRHGYPLKGYHFSWDESVDYTPEQQMEYEKMISDRYEVDPKYFADKYNMPVGERIQQPGLQLSRPFFD
ncbi:phage portal protein family protein [Segatella copri]|uniref:DUF935 family protein n=1 Tax=Segatella copri TaxID=165179 RepID=A0AA91A7G8_9BACT|nr:DUF935 family protein [Segatella copri]MQO91320.1 DUF935 family protein [Segatella copri]